MLDKHIIGIKEMVLLYATAYWNLQKNSDVIKHTVGGL